MRGFSFSWKRFLRITGIKQQVVRETGIPNTKQGWERKIGGVIIYALFGEE